MTTDDIIAHWWPDSADELRFRITILLAEKYMTTSTATADATVNADAVADAKRLKAAVDAVIAICPPIPPKP